MDGRNAANAYNPDAKDPGWDFKLGTCYDSALSPRRPAMTTSPSNSAQLAAAKTLQNSKEAADTRRWLTMGCSFDEGAAKIWSDYQSKASELGVPPSLWSIERSPDPNGYRISLEEPKSMFCHAYENGGPAAIKIAKHLLAAKATPWVAGIGDKSVMAQNPDVLAQMAFPPLEKARAAALSSIALELALATMDEMPATLRKATMPSHFLACMSERYMAAVSGSSATGSGVMGKADKHAKAAAQRAMALADKIEAAAKNTADPRLQSDIADMLADAKARSAAKSAVAAEDPAQIKRDLSEDEKIRLRAIRLIVENCPTDHQAISALVSSAAWLSSKPQALCLEVSAASIAECALNQGVWVVADAMERLGSNIWMASAQAGESNAALWAAQKMAGAHNVNPAKKSKALAIMRPQVARLLARGAYLDGAESPIEHALAKTDEALEQARAAQGAPLVAKSGPWRRCDVSLAVATLTEFRSSLEGLVLADIAVGAAPPPKASPAKRQRL